MRTFSDPITTQFTATNEIEEVLIEALIFSSFTAANKRDLLNYVGSLIEADRFERRKGEFLMTHDSPEKRQHESRIENRFGVLKQTMTPQIFESRWAYE
jgi:hypothetical protein